MALATPRLPIAHSTAAQQVKVVQTTLTLARKSAHLGPKDPFVVDLEAQTAALAEADRKVALLRKELTAAISKREEQQERFKQSCMSYVGHVTTIAKGDPAIISGAGLETRKPRTASVEPATPLVERATPGIIPGELTLRWTTVPRASIYSIERATEPGGPFVQVLNCTTRTAVLRNQPTNVPLWYRVRASGAGGDGAWSELVPAVVPLHPAHA